MYDLYAEGVIKVIKKIEKYMGKHPYYNSAAHVTIGIGLGILFARPYAGEHPLRWGLGLLAAGLAAHLYPLWVKK